jgi:hypothetical protein
MANNFVPFDMNLSTESNPAASRSQNHANKHDSPGSLAASDASSRNSGNQRNKRAMAVHTRGCWGAARREPAPRLRGRLGILRARQSHYLAPILLGFLFLFPFASAASISDLTFSNADVPNLSTGVGDLVAIDLNLPSSSHHFS